MPELFAESFDGPKEQNHLVGGSANLQEGERVEALSLKPQSWGWNPAPPDFELILPLSALCRPPLPLATCRAQ